MNKIKRSSTSVRHQSGISLLEVMVAIAISLGVASIALAIAVGARRDAQAANFENLLLRISASAQDLDGSTRFRGINDTILCKSGKLQDVCVNGRLIGPGGNIIGISGGAEQSLMILVRRLDKHLCVSAGTRFRGYFRSISVGATDVNGGDLKSATADQITQACQDSEATAVRFFYVGR